MVRYPQWKRGDDSCFNKLMAEVDADEALRLWQWMVKSLREHIHYKRRQFKEIRRITDSVAVEEILIHLDYSKNCKSKHQNEFQSAYFNNKSFSLFTACRYYRNGKFPITITTKESEKSRVTSLSCVNKIITHSMEKLNQQIKTVYIVSDVCASQFWSRYVLCLLTHIQRDIIEWDYSKVHHEKGWWMGSVLR